MLFVMTVAALIGATIGMMVWLAYQAVRSLDTDAAGAAPAYVFMPGVTRIDPTMEVRVVAGSDPALPGEVAQAVATIDQAAGVQWTVGPTVPWDGTTPVATLQLPEPAGQAWVFTSSPAARAGNPGWPDGDWTTDAVFGGISDGAIVRSLTEVWPDDPTIWPRGYPVVLHELTHVAGLADDPGAPPGVLSSLGLTVYSPGELAGLAALAGHPIPVPPPTSTTASVAPRPVGTIPARRPPAGLNRTVTAPVTPLPVTAPVPSGRVAPILAALRLLAT